MKKILFSIICSLLLACSLAAVSTRQSMTTMATSQHSVGAGNCKEVTNTLIRPSFETAKFGLNDIVTLAFSIESNDGAFVTSTSFNTNGFSVTQRPVVSQNSITTRIRYDGFMEKPEFTINAGFSNDIHSTATVYGYIGNGSLYISGNSIDDAKDLYLSEMLETQEITQSEYEEIANADWGGFVQIQTTNPLIAPLSFSGGWVQGTLQWQDDAGNIHPLQHMKVSIYDEDPIIEDNMGTVWTDSNGFFTFYFTSNQDDVFDSSGRDIFIRVWPEGTNSVVRTATGGERVWRSATTDNVTTGSTTTINRVFNMRDTGTNVGGIAGDGDLGRSFQISQAIIFGDRYVTAMRGSSISRITVRYPAAGSFYTPGSETISLIGATTDPDHADWDVIMHEYGHHVQHKLGISNSPGGSHSSTEDLSIRLGKDAGTRLAYGESWPTIFGELAQQYYMTSLVSTTGVRVAGVADGGYSDSSNSVPPYPGPLFSYNTISNVYKGEAVERAIMGTLWDLYDSDSGESHDSIAFGHSAWWNITTSNGKTTFTRFADHFYSVSNTNDRANFSSLLQYYSMFDTLLTYNTNGVITGTRHELSGTIDLPSVIFGQSITSIGTSVFANQAQLSHISIPASVTSIGQNAFHNNTYVEWEGNSELQGTKFIQHIGNQTTYAIPDCVTSIENDAFTNSPVTEIVIPSTVTSINRNAFSGSTRLKRIIVDSNNPNYASYNGVLYNKAKTLIQHVPEMTSGNFDIPDGVTMILDSTFRNRVNITSITIPTTVTSIGANAFTNTGLSEILIPFSVTSIDTSAFNQCSNLTNIKREYQVPIGTTGTYSLSLFNLNNGVVKVDGQVIYFYNNQATINLVNGIRMFSIEASSIQPLLTSIRPVLSIQIDTPYQGSTTYNHYYWYAYTALSSGEYDFFTTGLGKTTGELYESLSSVEIVGFGDSGSGEGDNFKITHYLNENQTIYIKVNGRSLSNPSAFALKVVKSNHMTHNYQHQGTATNHFLECMECKHRIHCSKTATYTGTYNDIAHGMSCSCGYTIPQAHDAYHSGGWFYCRVCPWKGRFIIEGPSYIIPSKVEICIEESK